MPSSAELVELFNSGTLGKLIATTFGGERGHVYENEDSDLLVEFADEDKVPDIGKLIACATAFYTSNGYKVEPGVVGQQKNGSGFVVSFDRSEGCVHVAVTTRYPHNRRRNTVRVTSSRVF